MNETNANESPETLRYDVVVLGGAIAGASTAVLLRRWQPDLKVLVVEKSTAFDWKVGESTVEISAYFLTRVLRLYDYLSRDQLGKQGFRYWFYNGDVQGFRQASEVGPYQLARTPGFQLDRARLDEHVLALAGSEGADVWRPARVAELRLKDETGEAENVVVVERGGRKLEIRCGWVVDASGRSALIARKKGMLRPLEAHPTASVWARFRNVKDLDGPAVFGTDPHDRHVRGVVAARRLATNHFTGYGYWIWAIPLRGGETSLGVVWDKRLVDVPGANPEDRLVRFLKTNPLTRELIEGAEAVPGDARMYGHLPYLVDRCAGDGWSCVGDAAGFLDPFYSPGLDQMAFSVSWTLEALKMRRTMEPAKFVEAVELHAKRYDRFFRYFFEAIYQDKYYLMGDYDTMTASFLMDTALYYAVAVLPLYRWTADRILVPPYYQDGAEVGLVPMRFYQRRLIAIAKRKKELGIYGRHNAGRRPGFVGFSVRSAAYVMLAHGVLRWWKAELANLWTYVVKPTPMRAAMPIPAAPPEKAPSTATVEPAAA